MNWLTLAIIAYLIYAIVFVADRVLVTKSFKQPITYAFYTSLLNSAVIFLIPVIIIFSSQKIYPASIWHLLIDFSAGALFFISIYFLYYSLFLYDASSMIPLIGSLTPLFSLIFTYLFLSEYLSWQQFIAFILLFIGGIFISIKKNFQTTIKCLFLGLAAAFFFGAFYTLTDYIYLTQPFWSGFIWARIGTALTAASVLLFPPIKRIIFSSSSAIKSKAKVGSALISVHALGAIAFLMINYALSLSYASLINALQGVQYVFLLFMVIFLSKKYPQLIKEELAKVAIAQKIIAIIFIGSGLIILAIYV